MKEEVDHIFSLFVLSLCSFSSSFSFVSSVGGQPIRLAQIESHEWKKNERNNKKVDGNFFVFVCLSLSVSVICLSIYLLMLFEDVSCAEDCPDDPTDIIGRAWWRQNNVMKMFQSTHWYFQQDLDLIHSSVDYDDRKKKDSLTLGVFVVIWFVRLSIVTQQVIDFRERLSCIDWLSQVWDSLMTLSEFHSLFNDFLLFWLPFALLHRTLWTHHQLVHADKNSLRIWCNRSTVIVWFHVNEREREWRFFCEYSHR